MFHNPFVSLESALDNLLFTKTPVRVASCASLPEIVVEPTSFSHAIAAGRDPDLAECYGLLGLCILSRAASA